LEWPHRIWSGRADFGVAVQILEWLRRFWSGRTDFGVAAQILEWPRKLLEWLHKFLEWLYRDPLRMHLQLRPRTDRSVLEFGRCPYLGSGTLPRRQPHGCENSASSVFSLFFYIIILSIRSIYIAARPKTNKSLSILPQSLEISEAADMVAVAEVVHVVGKGA
jgi:hypothetical protein